MPRSRFPHPAEAAKLVWSAYYGNHQKNEAFGKLKVADIFMGGGTTVVEGARLGMQMYGNDLNPVAWLIVKNELAQVDPRPLVALGTQPDFPPDRLVVLWEIVTFIGPERT